MSTAQYVCIVQEGQQADRKRAELGAGLTKIAADAFGDAPEAVEIRWVTVPTGYAFTAGVPSTSSLVARSVPVGFPEDQRERFMSSVCRMWTETTACSMEEIVVTALDGPLPL